MTHRISREVGLVDTTIDDDSDRWLPVIITGVRYAVLSDDLSQVLESKMGSHATVQLYDSDGDVHSFEFTRGGIEHLIDALQETLALIPPEAAPS